jgi:hypothetical protein
VANYRTESDSWLAENEDPLDEGAVDHFDYDEVDRLFGNSDAEQRDEVIAMAAQVMAILFRWMTDTPIRKNSDQYVGRRCLAAALVVNPDLFSGRSIAEISNLLGCTRATISKECSKFSKLFHIRSRGQVAHGWNFSENSRAKPSAETKLAA